MLRKGKPASFRLFPVGSYVVIYRAGSFLPTLFGLLKAIRWFVVTVTGHAADSTHDRIGRSWPRLKAT
jgi:hypothetical protein